MQHRSEFYRMSVFAHSMERLSGADWVGKKAIEVNSANFSKSKTPLQKIRIIYPLLFRLQGGSAKR